MPIFAKKKLQNESALKVSYFMGLGLYLFLNDLKKVINDWSN
jgi:hypothetical protein